VTELDAAFESWLMKRARENGGVNALPAQPVYRSRQLAKEAWLESARQSIERAAAWAEWSLPAHGERVARGIRALIESESESDNSRIKSDRLEHREPQSG